MLRINQNPFPLVFTISLTFIGFAITQLSYFIISISRHPDLWWSVINTVEISTINLILAYIMFIVGLVLMATGIVLTATRDRKI